MSVNNEVTFWLILCLLSIIIGWAHEDSAVSSIKNLREQKNHMIHKHYNTTKTKEHLFIHLEKLGELYYENQKVEREKKRQWFPDIFLLATFHVCAE